MKHLLSKDDTPQPAPPYTHMADIYDRMMMHVNYPKWAKYVSGLLQLRGFEKVDPLLDIGCGTGRFLEEMNRLRWHGDGCEPSEGMLTIAQKRLGNNRIFLGGFPKLKNVESEFYAVLTCLYDSMNYIMNREDFITSLQRAYDVLTAPGIFIFDVVSETHCRQFFQNYSDSEVISKELAYSRESYYDAGEQVQYNWVRIYKGDHIIEEEHQQRIYSYDEILNMIRENTAFQVEAFEDFSDDPATPKSGRIHFILKKDDPPA